MTCALITMTCCDSPSGSTGGHGSSLSDVHKLDTQVYYAVNSYELCPGHHGSPWSSKTTPTSATCSRRSSARPASPATPPRTGSEGIAAIRDHEPILTTLDISLPGIDGFEVARQIRSFSSTYIIMLSARDEEIDTLMGLDAGRRRLSDQAVPAPRAAGPDRGHAAPLPHRQPLVTAGAPAAADRHRLTPLSAGVPGRARVQQRGRRRGSAG